ncbi:amyloid beta A4 precursor protein-binding family B member 1-interacting protein-like isoform X2 [Hydractinia symbiolongicarpus]|uniref:amyloid beta A4 precursor protein-binding family B member 1-interacting protein-like isoform X2 n=1 Tax=Hydractinia symbiolongicarpus TaxID=13093 RepID=UPI00254BF26B|nr:amyloid beta A4 precursor protein-binding family B member 1-interacting protein-like isoform X2 [Hydractinia symbiolongicarpus]
MRFVTNAEVNADEARIKRYINTESSVLIPSSPAPKMDDLPPPPPQLNTSDSSDVSFPTPPPPMSPDFPSPPMSPPVPDATLEAESPIGSSEKLHGKLSRTSSAGSALNEDDSQSEEEDLDFTDADKAIDKMLDDLEDFQMELGPDPNQDKKDDFKMLSPTHKPAPPPISDASLDHLRFSMGNFEETPEVDLDALLEDLCSMERDIKNSSTATLQRKGYNISSDPSTISSDSSQTINEDNGMIEFTPVTPTKKIASPVRVTHDVKERLENLQNEMESKELTPEEQEARLKAEKMKIALEKMKEASFQKLFIKVYNSEIKTTKTMMIDQTWTSRDVMQKMIQKDDVEIGPNWCIVEKLPDMHMERILEDHEYILQTVLDWSREIENNMLVFLNRRDKYILFRNPQNFLLSSDLHSSADTKFAEKSKDILLSEFFTKETTQIPHLEGVLWLREGTKKWTKHFFALRASGIYYTPKGKQKSRDLSCLVKFELTNIYLGVSFKKKFKSPTDYVFCIKHPKIQTIKSKHIFCFCAEDSKMLYQWMVGCRMAKYGYNMFEDYIKTQEEVESVLLAGSRSTLTSNGTSAASTSTSSGFVSTSSSSASLPTTVLEKKTDRYKTATKTALKNAEGEVKRVKGKQNSLGDIFSTAWSKGVDEQATGVPDIMSPTSPVPATPMTASIMSPPIQPRTFDISNRAMSHLVPNKINDKNEPSAKLTLEPAPLGRRASGKSKSTEELSSLEGLPPSDELPPPPDDFELPSPPSVDCSNLTVSATDRRPSPGFASPPPTVSNSKIVPLPSPPSTSNNVTPLRPIGGVPVPPPPPSIPATSSGPPQPPPLNSKPNRNAPPPPPLLDAKPGRSVPPPAPPIRTSSISEKTH